MATPFMLVSLKEEDAKKLSRVLGSPTCTKILEHLSKKEATETEISKSLKIPISTVHYNLQQLVEAKLVLVEEFHYSKKGREVNHYKLANKYIIIAPQAEDESFMQHLKKFLPLTILTFGAAAILKTMQFLAPQQRSAEVAKVQAFDMAAESAGAVSNLAAPSIENIPWWQAPLVDWAIIGALAVLVLVFVVEAYRWSRKN